MEGKETAREGDGKNESKFILAVLFRLPAFSSCPSLPLLRALRVLRGS
jgi:hypothetical protein